MKLRFDPFADGHSGRVLILGYFQIAFSGLFPVGSGLLPNGLFYMKMVYDGFGNLPCLVEQSQIGWVSNVLRTYCRIIDHLAFVFGLVTRRIFIVFVVLFGLFTFPGAFVHVKKP